MLTAPIDSPDVGWDGSGLLIVGDQVEMFGGQERVFESLLQRYPAADAVALRFRRRPGHEGRALRGAERVRGLRAPGSRRSLLTPVALPALRACHARLLRRPDRLIANSNYAADHMRGEHGLVAEVLHPPVRDDFFSPAPRERRHWLAVGRVTTQKRFDVLLAAFAKLDAPLVVAGTGPALNRMRAVAPPNVSLVGFVDDDSLRELYRSARGLIVPSLETFGLVTAEALACGTPVIAQRAGGSLELVREGVNGVFLESLDPSAVMKAVEAVERLAPDPEACRASVEPYSEQRFLARMDTVLDAERALAHGLAR